MKIFFLRSRGLNVLAVIEFQKEKSRKISYNKSFLGRGFRICHQIPYLGHKIEIPNVKQRSSVESSILNISSDYFEFEV